MSRIDFGAEEAIARLATRNSSLVTRDGLVNEGVRPVSIDRRVHARHLRPVHPGVYFAGHGELSRDQRHLAAVLACQPDAWLASASATELWRVLSAAPGPPEVLATGRRRDGPAGVRLRRTCHLPPHERTVHRGIPVTTPARTLLDLAATDHSGLELALNEAFALRLVARPQLDALAMSGRRGGARLRALLEDAPGYTREEAERLLRSLVLKAQFPRPLYNHRVEGRERDAVWLEHRVVVEIDGYAAHGTRTAFERDRRRDQELSAHGWRPLRITWRQLVEEPEAVIARLAAALALALAAAS